MTQTQLATSVAALWSFDHWKLFGHWCLMLDHSVSGGLALALFVPGVRADDVHFSLAAHDLTVLANLLHAGTNFHGANFCAGFC
jgi:hypothetical protein